MATATQIHGGGRTSAKVAEIFLTAGTAFNRLGELALDLSTVGTGNGNDSRWTETEIGPLKTAIERFAADLSKISERVKLRCKEDVKADLKAFQFDKPTATTIILGKRKQTNSGVTGETPAAKTKVVTVANIQHIQQALQKSAGEGVGGKSLVTSVVAGLKSQSAVGGNITKMSSGIPQGFKTIIVKGSGAKVATGPVQVRPTASQRSSASESSAKGAGSNFVGYGEDEHFEDDYEGETDDENDEDYSSEESEEEEEGEIIT